MMTEEPASFLRAYLRIARRADRIGCSNTRTFKSKKPKVTSKFKRLSSKRTRADFKQRLTHLGERFDLIGKNIYTIWGNMYLTKEELDNR